MIVGNEVEIKKVKEEIKVHLKTKEDGDMKNYVGCTVARKKYNFMYRIDLIEKLEKEFEDKLGEVKGGDSPTIVGEGAVMTKEHERIQDKLNHMRYRSGVGMLHFRSNIRNQISLMLLGNFQKQT